MNGTYADVSFTHFYMNEIKKWCVVYYIGEGCLGVRVFLTLIEPTYFHTRL